MYVVVAKTNSSKTTFRFIAGKNHSPTAIVLAAQIAPALPLVQVSFEYKLALANTKGGFYICSPAELIVVVTTYYAPLESRHKGKLVSHLG